VSKSDTFVKGGGVVAKGKFNLTSLLNSKSKGPEALNTDSAETTRAGNDFKVDLISVYQLEPSQDNFYSVEDVANLKDSIEIMGIHQNLTVKRIPNTDKYKVIAGHRRRLASLQLVEEGKKQFELVPCRIETSLDEIRERILLIYTNSTTRQLSDWEKVEQLSQLKGLLKEYKKEHELPGRVRELLAEALNVSTTQVGRIESINDNLTTEFKEELKQDNIKFSTAVELSKLTKEDQKAVYEQHKEKGSTSLKDVAKVNSKENKYNTETAQLTVNAAKKIKGILEQRLSIAKHDSKNETEKTELTEYMRILSVLVKVVDKEVFKVMGEDIFKNK
jgi:ParB family chromosome partitioning protein